MSIISKGALFPKQLEQEIFAKAMGHSTLAKLSGQEAIPFNGKDVFVFSRSAGVEIVGENADKSAGDGAIAPVSIVPIKVVFQDRFSDEFMYASEEYQLDVLRKYAEAFAQKLGEGLDVMAMHGANPYDGSASSVIGTNNFDSKVTNTVVYASATADENIEDALELIADGYNADGIAIAPAMRTAISKLTTTGGGKKYPDFAFGSTPGVLGSMTLDTNATVGAASSTDKALMGDFSAFKWGIAKNLPLEIIEHGDPDGQGDLKRKNQICIRSEAYLGWGILDADAFAIVKG